RVRALLESSPGHPSFNTAQELAQQLVGLLGGDPSAVRYDPATHLLTYAIQFTHVFASSETPIAFDADLGQVAGIQSSSTLRVTAAVHVALTFGVDLSPLAPDTTPSDPSDDDSLGRHFFLVNPTVSGTIDLSASDITAVARLFKFVEIGIQPGRGTITWPDLTNPASLDVQFQHLDALLDFQHFGFQQFVDALQGVLQYLQSIEGLGFLGQKLPLINRSAIDLFALADKLAQKIEAFSHNPGQTLQVVKQLIANAFGADPAAVALSLDGPALRIDLSFASTFTESFPFNIDLASLGLGSLANLIGGGASGKVDLVLGARFDLHVGIDLTIPTSPTPFLYDTTALTLEAKAAATAL